jgi:hypothetical protein
MPKGDETSEQFAHRFLRTVLIGVFGTLAVAAMAAAVGAFVLPTILQCWLRN